MGVYVCMNTQLGTGIGLHAINRRKKLKENFAILIFCVLKVTLSADAADKVAAAKAGLNIY